MISGHPGSLGWLIFGKKGQTTMSKNLVIGLKKPYLFEDEEYDAIDLSGMENLTMQDAIEAQKNVVGTGEDSVILYAPEASQAFIDEIAAMAAKQPVEFFNGMPIGLSDKVRTAVQGVFSADGNKAKDRVVTLDKPYTYDGKAVSVIDLSGVEELTSKDVSAAENEVLKTGIYSANMKNFFVYSCALASRATGNPIEFFTKMPLVDAVKVRSTVNSASFFE